MQQLAHLESSKLWLKIFTWRCSFCHAASGEQTTSPPTLSVKPVTEGDFEQFLNNSHGQRQARTEVQVLIAACLILFHSYAGF